MTTTQKLEWARIARILFLTMWAVGFVAIITGQWGGSIAAALFIAAGLFMSSAAVSHYHDQVKADREATR